MGILISFLLWVFFSAIIFLLGKFSFPDTDNMTIIALSVTIGWIAAMILSFIWTKGAPQQAEENDSEKKPEEQNNTGYPGGPAEHLVGVSSQPGMLYLYPDGLVFKPKISNEPRKEWNINYTEIAEVNPGHFKNLMIVSKSGKKEALVVDDKEKWAEEIKKRII